MTLSLRASLSIFLPNSNGSSASTTGPSCVMMRACRQANVCPSTLSCAPSILQFRFAAQTRWKCTMVASLVCSTLTGRMASLVMDLKAGRRTVLSLACAVIPMITARRMKPSFLIVIKSGVFGFISLVLGK